MPGKHHPSGSTCRFKESECFHCKKMGHLARACRENKALSQRRQSTSETAEEEQICRRMSFNQRKRTLKARKEECSELFYSLTIFLNVSLSSHSSCIKLARVNILCCHLVLLSSNYKHIISSYSYMVLHDGYLGVTWTKSIAWSLT